MLESPCALVEWPCFGDCAPRSDGCTHTEGTQRYMGRWGLAIILPALLLMCIGCAGGMGAPTATTPVATPTRASDKGTVQDYATLVAALTAAGATAQPGEEH